MSLLYISEYAALGSADGDLAQVPQEPPLATQVVDYTSGEAKSATLNAETRIVLMKSAAACHVLFGEDPTADTNDEPIFANVPEYKGVAKDSGLKISVISA